MNLSQFKRSQQVSSSVSWITFTISFTYALSLFLGCENPNHILEVQDPQINSQSISGGVAVETLDPIATSTVALYLEGSTLQGITDIQNFCTGTLIAKNVVLTAAHCFVDAAEDIGISIEALKARTLISFETRIFKSKAEAQVPWGQVQSVSVHPLYKAGTVSTAFRVAMWDVALIFLTSEAPASARSAHLITSNTQLIKGLPITLAGYGIVNTNPIVESHELRKVIVQVENPLLTKSQFSYLVKNGKGSCSGDSGGPAYLELANGELGVIGITSWGDRFCKSIGAYTSVPTVSTWIQSEMNLNPNFGLTRAAQSTMKPHSLL